MTFYKCKKCDEVYEIIFEGTSCSEHGCACEEMEELKPKTADFKTEKHVPVVTKTANGIRVTVGSTPHPMVKEHWITMIEVVAGNKHYRAYLKPGDPPSAEFPVQEKDVVVAREYCNVHGLWANKA